MSEAVQAALPWIVCGLAVAILVPGLIDFFRGKGREAAKSAEDEKKQSELNSWMMEGIGLGLLVGYWIGRFLGNAVLGLALGVLAGMFIGSKIRKFK